MSLKALFLIASLFVAVKDSVPFNLFIAFNIALSTAFFALSTVSAAIFNFSTIAFVSFISGVISSTVWSTAGASKV